MSVKMVYMTVGSRDEARSIGRSLIESRLAACVNIIDGMHSIYWWEGALEEAVEVVMIAKTTDIRLPALVRHVKEKHSYECPCIVSLPVENGYQPFLNWIATEVDGSM